jgi:hypothetical protein
MNTQKLLNELGYKNNPAFLQGKKLEKHYGYSFFFSQASQNIDKNRGCNLKGVYRILDSSENSKGNSITPVVYVCEAANEDQAGKIHKRVWNQNIAPFLFVVTPQNIHLYSGFDYGDKKNGENQSKEIARNDDEILTKFSAITARAIDSGQIWEQKKISTTRRVDRHLLSNLEKLSSLLRSKYQLPIEIVHCLIGKYIYLKYLRDRGILSDSKFAEAGVIKDEIFSGNAHKNKLYQLENFLNNFLNGSVFLLPNEKDIKTEHIREVVTALEGGDSGQRTLFDMYDFSCIPIETLSVVYQQFLYQKGDTKKKGAYYTPVHLVNFILDELNAKKPLKRGMKVFDPSCGSGAFLVQCYRRLVESILRGKNEKLKPSDLRDILTKNIFGLDVDKEACQVAQLSLSLTLLDYIDPPDLTKTNFKLPDLGKSNIFHCEGGFFDNNSPWVKFIERQKKDPKYDWIVGNPPWKNIDEKKDDKLFDKKAIEWIKTNKKLYPVDNYQVAEAFAWKATKLLDEKGQCGLLMPAKTLFKKQGKQFRAKFFSEKEMWCIVNFSNIRKYLFEGAINPAAAFFFSGRKNWNKTEHYITTYAPFAVELSSQLNQSGRSKKLWSIFVNYSLIKDIPLKDIVNGSAEPWKIAMWGTQRDKMLINFISKKYGNILTFKENNALAMGQGPELESLPFEADAETIKKFYAAHRYLPEYIGEDCILTDKIPNNCMRLPEKGVYRKLRENDVYLRLRGGETGLDLFKAPHILISAARKFSVYADNKDFIVPTRQIGIAGNNSQRNLLKALALYLNSDFVNYHQWLISASWGIERDNSNFDDLKRLPIPLSKLSTSDLDEWAKLHDKIAIAYQNKGEPRTVFDYIDLGNGTNDIIPTLDDLLIEMNKKVYGLLGINKKQQWLIEDMLNDRMKLNDGKIAQKAIKHATKEEIKEFAKIFQNELDLFLDETGKKKVHKVKVFYTDNTTAMIIEHLQKAEAGEPEILEVKDSKTKLEFDNLQSNLIENRSQWIYYTRCLKIYDKLNRKTYIFKPRQRLYWLKSQALVEADDFLAEKIGGE